MLFKLRVRKPFGADDDLIEAADLDQAQAIGHAYCEQTGYKYIGVGSAVVATASILEPDGPALPAEAVAKKARVGA